MRWPRRKVVIATSAAAVATGLAVALVVILSGPGAPEKLQPSTSHQLFSPFTGEPVGSLGPVLTVKIDNIAQARPPTGLTDADIVYVLPVEGGLSRILAVFSSFPAGHRAGAQRPGGRSRTAPAIRPARLRLFRGTAAPAAFHRAGQDR